MQSIKLVKSIIVAAVVIASAGILACSRGDTAGDSGSISEAESSSDTFTADGGSGGTLTLNVSSSILVGERKGFSVVALDPSGAPLEFIKIVCESEGGLAITEPNNGVQSTGSNGLMSGQIGGVVPGSYVLECRGPQGFNLVARATVVVRGTGSATFGGAAGGNLGGARTPES